MRGFVPGGAGTLPANRWAMRFVGPLADGKPALPAGLRPVSGRPRLERKAGGPSRGKVEAPIRASLFPARGEAAARVK